MIDQVRLLNQNGYDRLWWDDFEAGGSGWTLARGSGAPSDWWLNTEPVVQLVGTASTACYMSPDLDANGVPGQWAELRTPPLSLQGNYVLEFALKQETVAATKFEVRLFDGNDNLITNLFSFPASSQDPLYSVAYPANYVNSIAVGACTDFDRRADYSAFGSELFCVSPSAGGWNDVATTDTTGAAGWNTGDWENGDYFMGFGGTSSATPLVAGVANLILSKNGNLTPSQLKDSLRLGCDKIGGVTYLNGWHREYGYGRVNAIPNPNSFVLMKLLERNGDRTDPWAFGWPALKIGFRALFWPEWKRYNVLPCGCTDSRLSQVNRPVRCQRRRSKRRLQNP